MEWEGNKGRTQSPLQHVFFFGSFLSGYKPSRAYCSPPLGVSHPFILLVPFPRGVCLVGPPSFVSVSGAEVGLWVPLGHLTPAAPWLGISKGGARSRPCRQPAGSLGRSPPWASLSRPVNTLWTANTTETHKRDSHIRLSCSRSILINSCSAVCGQARGLGHGLSLVK